MTKEVSRTHNDAFLAREARETEALRLELGNDVVAKLDRWLLRDTLYARRRRQFEELVQVPDAERGRFRSRVMINLGSGRRQSRETAAVFRARVSDKAKASPPAVTASELRRRTLLRGEKATVRLAKDLEQDGIKVLDSLWITHSVVAEMDVPSLARVARRSDVASFNHDKRLFALSLDVSRPLVGADQVENNLGFTGNGLNVAVVDTGVDFTHAALSGSMGSSNDFTGEGVGDLHGHGSHCAGVVGSRDGKRRGMAPTVTIHEVKVMDQFGSTSSAIAVNGLQSLLTINVQVASNSWGFTHADGAWVCDSGNCVLCVAADNAVTMGGIVVVVAAGNEDNDGCGSYDTHIRCPGNAREVITVAASDDSDDMADFSSIGPTNDGRAKPDVTAPGVDIVSVRSSTGSDMGGSAPVVEEIWSEASGTSMACPHVAGVCALMLEKTRTATPATIKAALMSTAVDIGASADEMGAGRMDALAAVNAI